MNLDTENVIVRTNCGRKFNLDDLIRYGSALKDKMSGAAYRFTIPSVTGDREAVVRVYSNGTIVASGSNTVHRGVMVTKRVMDLLGCKGAVSICQVIMSGTISVPGSISGIISKLDMDVKFVQEIMGGMIIVRDSDVLCQIFPKIDLHSVRASGPDEKTIWNSVKRIEGQFLS